jgi:DNA-binding response OmpR family regulator
MTMLERIMVVEDDPDILDILDMSLAMLGDFDVTLCESVGEALERMVPSDPQLIVMDVMMPVLSGPEALPMIRALPGGNQRVIVMMTARASAQDRAQYLGLGADEVLLKPFEPTELPAVLRAVWGARQARA